MTERNDVFKSPVVALAAGTAAVAVEGVTAASRLVASLPVVGPLLRRGVNELTARGDKVISQSLDPLRAIVAAVVVQVVDIDAIAAEIDIDAIIARIDLVGLSNEVIDGVDLPAIIRESTNSVTADVMTDVRSQGERADDIIAGMVDRVLGRSRSRDDAE